MLFQLTSAGRTLINTEGLLTQITKVEFGSGYDYVPANEPTGLNGTEVYETTAVFSPVAVDANTIRFTVLIPAAAGPFTFGEISLYAGATLVGVGANVTQITKVVDADGNPYRIDIYVDLLSGQRFASWEVVSSFTRNFFPRIPSPDNLIPPHFDTNNAYVIYGDGGWSSAYLAFSDTSGRWHFSGKPREWFSGTIDSVTQLSMVDAALVDPDYFGDANELVIQFTSGVQRGICRRLSTLSTGTVTWSTQLVALPEVGDTYVIMGPSVGSTFNGSHDSLAETQGGDADEQYHLMEAEWARVVHPKFKTVKVVTTTPYAVADGDNDAYIVLKDQAAFNVTLDDAAFTTFPVGGCVMFRYINTDVTLARGGSTVIDPYNTINIPTSSGTFAIVKRANGQWDYMATVAEEETFDGNVRHKYVADGGTRSLARFVPMYKAGEDEDGPVCDVTSSKLQMTESGGLRIWPGSLNATPVWDSPAVILFGVESTIGITTTTNTGLANDATSYTLAGTVNSIPFNVSLLGSAAQTYAQLLVAFNTQLYSQLGSASIASLTITGYGLILSTDGVGSSQNITITTSTLITSLTGAVLTFRTSHTGTTNSVSEAAAYLNYYDTPTNNNRMFRAGFGALVVGLQNSAAGQSGFSIGGAYNFAGGNYSGILGGTTNRSVGLYTLIIGGFANAIQPYASLPNNQPRHVVVFNSERSLIETPSTSTGTADVPSFSSIWSASKATLKGSYSTVQNSKVVYSEGFYNSVLGSENVTIRGTRNNIVGSKNIDIAGAVSNANVLNTEDVNITGGSSISVIGVKGGPVSLNQSSVTYLPNAVANAAGKPSLTAAISTGAYGSGDAIALTTDGATIAGSSATNLMKVPTGEAWTMHINVLVNYPTGCKSWSIRALVKNVGGTVSIAAQQIEEAGNILATYMTAKLVVSTANADCVNVEINSRNDSNTGYTNVSATAMATIAIARNLP